MSATTLYPISLIQHQRLMRHAPVIMDEFDDGTTSARVKWNAQNFKRQFSIQHSPLTLNEFRYLRSFWSRRNGKYDSFWYRDNVDRSGNAEVRFASDLPSEWSGAAKLVAVDLEEISPIRMLPEFDELSDAAGSLPLIWSDCNRERYYLHAGTAYAGEANSVLFDPLFGSYVTSWQAGSTLANLGNTLGQYQHWRFDGTAYAKTSANISQLTGAQPACTVFLICKHSAAAADQVLFSVGATGSGSSLGIALKSDNTYRIWFGAITGSLGYTNTADTWRSIAMVFPSGSNSTNFYVNAALYATINPAITRSFVAGPAAIGAAVDGSSISNPSNALTNANLAQVMLFNSALTLAQVKAVHNLVGYQYGLATV